MISVSRLFTLILSFVGGMVLGYVGVTILAKLTGHRGRGR